jgi:hypothetical protein
MPTLAAGGVAIGAAAHSTDLPPIVTIGPMSHGHRFTHHTQNANVVLDEMPADRFDEMRREWAACHAGVFPIQKRRAEIFSKATFGSTRHDTKNPSGERPPPRTYRPPGPALRRISRDPGIMPPNYAGEYANWSVLQVGGNNAIYHPRLNSWLAGHPIVAVERSDELWLPRGLHEAARRCARPDFDDLKVRPVTDIRPGISSVTVQRTLYSAGLVTDHLASHDVWLPGQDRPLSPDGVLLDSDSRISVFADSGTANIMGGTVLAITADGRVLLQYTGQHNAMYAGLIAGSAAGSADWSGLQMGMDLLTFVQEGMRHELTEELGLPEHPPLSAIKVIGFARITERGGAPEFFGVAKLCAGVQPQVIADERRYIGGHLDYRFDPAGGVTGLVVALREIQSLPADRVGFGLRLNIVLLLQWIEANRTKASDWLFGDAATATQSDADPGTATTAGARGGPRFGRTGTRGR